MVAVLVIGILAAIMEANFSIQQAGSRDANRRDTIRGIQTALEQYRVAKGTYFVYGGTLSSSNPTPTLDSLGRMVLSGDTNATGGTGGGWGRVNLANAANPAVSVTQVLRTDGYLATIQTDPSKVAANDFQLTLCQSGTSPVLATAPFNALEYALIAKLERTNSDTSTNATGICNGNYSALGAAALSTVPAHTFAVASRRW